MDIKELIRVERESLSQAILMASGIGMQRNVRYPNIPNLDPCSIEVCKKIFLGIRDYFKNNEPESNVLDKLPIYGSFCAYAGIGAAAVYQYDNVHFKKEDLYEILTKERGIFAMDEYVFDYIGIGFGTYRQKEISKDIKTITKLIHDRNLGHFNRTSESLSVSEYFLVLMVTMKVMFDLGFAFQMQKCGLNTNISEVVRKPSIAKVTQSTKREILTQRLKAMKAEKISKPEMPLSNAMCYSIKEPEYVRVKCVKCGKLIEVEPYSSVFHYCTSIRELGYDCKIENWCKECAEIFDKKAFVYRSAEVLYIRLSRDEDYRRSLVDGREMKVLYSFLKNQNKIDDYNYVGENAKTIEKILGLTSNDN